MNRRDVLTALLALPAITAIAVAKLDPGDVIVIEAPGFVSAEQVQWITNAIHRVWPDRQVVVLDGGLTMRIVRA